MVYINRIIFLVALCLLSLSVFSDNHASNADTVIEKENNGLLYIGLGSADDSDIVGEEPWSVGFIFRDTNSSYGFDIGGEGVMLDGTYGIDSIEQAISYNLLGGMKISGDSNWRTDLGILIGIVEQSAECPRSYVGYQCYADYPAEYEYTFNYGLMLHTTYDRVTFGIRATGESTQIIFGINF